MKLVSYEIDFNDMHNATEKERSGIYKLMYRYIACVQACAAPAQQTWQLGAVRAVELSHKLIGGVICANWIENVRDGKYPCSLLIDRLFEKSVVFLTNNLANRLIIKCC